MMKRPAKSILTGRALAGAGVLAAMTLAGQASAENATSDPLMNALIKKGILSEDEARSIKAEADASQSNNAAVMPEAWNKWKINSAIKSVELFGDIRLRYEGRHADTPDGGRVELERMRYALRLGLRGEAAGGFYYGLRLETAANPRSPWVTFGAASGVSPGYTSGPFNKGNAGINLGQIFIGWRPENWVDITVGKMQNPLYTTSMVWDPDINPEGAAEHFSYDVGGAQFFTTLGQFLYADFNPSYGSPGLINGLIGQTSDETFQIAWQAGMKYQVTTNISAKIAASLYQYIGLQSSTLLNSSTTSPYYGDTYVGEGAYAGAGSFSQINGGNFPAPGQTVNPSPGLNSVGFANNQVGLDHLLVVEVPFEFNFKITSLNAKVFGDFAYNLDGAQRARDAATGYATYLANGAAAGGTPATTKAFSPQIADVKAYQLGFALGDKDCLGMVNGSACKKNAWEVRSYWQHVEQYALDVNLMDSDFFEGRGNLEGLYAAAAYGLADNTIATIRYGHANRINKLLGTGGSNQDIPQVNPVNEYDIFQADLTFKF